jgi:hypothetical protein
MAEVEVGQEFMADVLTIEITGRMAAWSPSPDDVLVVNVDAFISTDQVCEIRSQMASIFPGHRILVLGKGMSLQIVKKEEVSHVPD